MRNPRLPKLLCPLVAALALVPAIPARADDPPLPRSTFITPSGSILLRLPLSPAGRIEGESFSVQGVQGVMVRYCNTSFCQYRFEQNTTSPQRQHWTFDVPPDGRWQVNVRAVDTAGNMEQPGPEITIAVVPVDVPPLPPLPIDVPTIVLPPLPELPALPPIPVPR
jgi:hypothetical protein